MGSNGTHLGSLGREFSDDKYYAVTRSGEMRIDLHISDGKRISLPYGYIQNIELGYVEGKENVTLNIPGVYFIQIIGEGLTPIYEALNRSSVRYIRPATKEGETPGNDGSLVSGVYAFALSDPASEFEELQNREGE